MVWRGSGSGLLGWLTRPRAGAGEANGIAAAGQPGPPRDAPLAPGAGSADQPVSDRSVPERPLPDGASIEDTVAPEDRGDIPRWLRTSAAWGWRLLLLGVLVYLLARIAAVLYVVVVPCAASLLLTALLHPLESRLRRRGWPPLASTWCTLLLAIVLVAGVTALATARIQAEYPTLLSQLHHTTAQVESWLSGPPFHLKTENLDKASGNIVKYLSQHQSLVEGTVVTGGRIAAEILAGVVLTVFVTFFLIKDGRRIWVFLIHRMRPANQERVDRAGRAAWTVVEYYVRGTVAVAAIHAIVMGITLSVMNAPLAVPIALFMFMAAFIPLVGVLIAGTLAVLVVLATKGLVLAIIVVGILIVMNQLEGHLLQPQIVGKMVRLHPLAVILVLAVGGVVAGIAGAVVAVPITAALSRAIPELRRDTHVYPVSPRGGDAVSPRGGDPPVDPPAKGGDPLLPPSRGNPAQTAGPPGLPTYRAGGPPIGPPGRLPTGLGTTHRSPGLPPTGLGTTLALLGRDGSDA